MDWTEDNVELLMTLWAQGLSAQQIADKIPGMSRNAVLGKIKRMGKQRFKPAGPQPSRRAPPPPKAAPEKAPPKLKPAPPLPVDDPGIPRVRPEHVHNGCRWPIGDPHDSDFGFCGAPRAYDDPPYCDPHHRRAFQKSGIKGDIQRLAIGADRNIVPRRY